MGPQENNHGSMTCYTLGRSTLKSCIQYSANTTVTKSHTSVSVDADNQELQILRLQGKAEDPLQTFRINTTPQTSSWHLPSSQDILLHFFLRSAALYSCPRSWTSSLEEILN